MNPVNYLMMLLGKNEDRTKILAAIHLAHNSTLPLIIDRHRVLLHLIGAKRNLRIIKAIISHSTLWEQDILLPVYPLVLLQAHEFLQKYYVQLSN